MVLVSLFAYRIRNLTMEIFKCCHGMNPLYLNDLFCKQEMKYDMRDKTLLEQTKFSTKITATRHLDIMEQNYGIPCLSR